VNQANIGRFNTYANIIGNTGGLSRHYKLVENVTLPPAPTDGSNWTAIGTSSINSFRGSFDGGGHTISGLTININNTSTYTRQGMFAFIGTGGVVKNLGLISLNISSGSGYLGGITGQADNATISNSYVIGNVENGGGGYMGGVVGYITNTTISNVFFVGSANGSIEDGVAAGGVVGLADNATVISNCYAIADVVGGSTGGVMGFGGDSKITNCYAIGSIRNIRSSTGGGYRSGGVLGYAFNSEAIVENSIALNHTVTATATSSSGVGRVSGAINSTRTNNRAWDGMDVRHSTATDGTGGTVKSISSSLTGLDGLSVDRATIRTKAMWEDANFSFGNDDDNPWVWEEGRMPRLYFEPHGRFWPAHLRVFDGTAQDPFLITNEEELRMVGRGTANPPGYTGWTLSSHYELGTDIDLTGKADWVPIGGESDVFTGGFYGGGHTITGLTVNNSEGNYQAMFRYISGGRVERLRLTNVNITGTGATTGATRVGGLAGAAHYGTVISDVHVTGTITNTVDALNNYTGGIVAYSNSVSNGITISNSSVNADITVVTTAGGMVGFLTGGTISNCYVGGSITGNGAGGVVSWLTNAAISSCHVSANVTATGYNSAAGGIVRYLSSNTSISNCYATGRVISLGTGSTTRAGGLVGTASSSNVIIENSVAMNETVRLASNAYDRVGRVVGFGSVTLRNNRAWSGTSVIHSTASANPVVITNIGSGALDGKHGLSISNADLQSQETWGATGSNTTGAQFSFGSPTAFAPWVWQFGRMPRLWFEYSSQEWPCEVLGNCIPIPFPEHTPPTFRPTPAAVLPPPPPPSAEPSGNYALTIEGSNIVTSEAVFVVSAPEGALSTVVVYDYMGNVVFVRTGVRSGERVIWDLTNASGRPVSAGSYLAIAASRDRGGRVLRGSVRLGVGR
jgi:hypothetical protein